MKELKGKIYYASKKAQHDRLYKEGRNVTVSNYHSLHYLSDKFVDINLDSSGTSYIHLQVA